MADINLVIEDEIEVLDAGSGYDATPIKAFFPNARVTRLDINKDTKPDIVQDLTKPLPKKWHNKFDVVFCGHVLEHIDRLKVIKAIETMVSAVRPGGELWILVPSLEWAAKQVLLNQNHTAVQGLLYGSQDNPYQYHRVAFTIPLLRDVMTRRGLVIRAALQGAIELNYATPLPAMQNIVIGWKPME